MAFSLAPQCLNNFSKLYDAEVIRVQKAQQKTACLNSSFHPDFLSILSFNLFPFSLSPFTPLSFNPRSESE